MTRENISCMVITVIIVISKHELSPYGMQFSVRVPSLKRMNSPDLGGGSAVGKMVNA